MGNQTKRTYRIDQDRKGKRTELSSTTQTIHSIPATLHAGTKRRAYLIRLFRSKERQRRIRSRRLEKKFGD